MLLNLPQYTRYEPFEMPVETIRDETKYKLPPSEVGMVHLLPGDMRPLLSNQRREPYGNSSAASSAPTYSELVTR